MTMIVNTPLSMIAIVFVYTKKSLIMQLRLMVLTILLILSAQDTRIAKVPILMYSLYIKHKII